MVAAEYELEHLLLEGHCYDITTGQPPRGLQFTLGTSASPVVVDTIVMANLVTTRALRGPRLCLRHCSLGGLDPPVGVQEAANNDSLSVLNMSEIKIHADYIGQYRNPV